MYKYSQTSRERLKTCNDDLQKVFNLAIQRSKVDFGIACGYRPIEVQKELYAQGRTKPGAIVTHIDGVTKLSKHNKKPSDAVDIYAWVNGKASWDEKHLCFVSGVIMACADELDIPIRWGGNWDGDGEIISDQNFMDLPHFETI